MRVLLLLDRSPAEPIQAALAQRGHRVDHRPVVSAPMSPDVVATDLIVADVEMAQRVDLIGQVANAAPGIEFVLVGPKQGAPHPDVIEQLDRPLDLERLLAVVDELAEIRDGERLRQPIDLVAYDTVFAGDSPQIRDLQRNVRLVARSEAPVWIYGDDGSGRPIVARAVHDRSTRRAQPFLTYNAAAYSDEDLCRKLFHGDGAAVKVARTGTLFLERISLAGPNLQRELVHYLETHDGGPRLIIGIQRAKGVHAHQPFVAAELYYRLKVLEIDIPALCERARDLEQIVARMLGRLSGDGKSPTLSPETTRILSKHSFPGNLLELAHALTHAYVLARGGAIQPDHLPISIRQSAVTNGSNGESAAELEALDVVAKRFERDYLLQVLRSVAGNRGRAAEILGLSRKGLWGKLKSHGISDDDIADAP